MILKSNRNTPLSFGSETLANGRFIVAVQRRGLLILDSRGHLHGAFYEENGLPEPTVLGLSVDRSGGAWICGDSGIKVSKG